jgi:hypothetical protein
MSRTRHVTTTSKRPHRQQPRARLTRLPDGYYVPYEGRPKNAGPGAVCGGYAADRAGHARAKVLGRRRERRRRNRDAAE